MHKSHFNTFISICIQCNSSGKLSNIARHNKIKRKYIRNLSAPLASRGFLKRLQLLPVGTAKIKPKHLPQYACVHRNIILFSKKLFCIQQCAKSPNSHREAEIICYVMMVATVILFFGYIYKVSVAIAQNSCQRK